MSSGQRQHSCLPPRPSAYAVWLLYDCFLLAVTNQAWCVQSSILWASPKSGKLGHKGYSVRNLVLGLYTGFSCSRVHGWRSCSERQEWGGSSNQSGATKIQNWYQLTQVVLEKSRKMVAVNISSD